MRQLLHTIFGRISKVDWLNMPTGTYVRYILAIIAAVNTILAVFNITPVAVDQAQLYDVISAIIMLLVLAVNTYKDNPSSPEAIESNKYLQMLKNKEAPLSPKDE